MAYRAKNRTECLLESADELPGAISVQVNLLPSGPRELTIYKGAEGAEAVSGLGDEAVWAMSTMVAVKDGRSASARVHAFRKGVDGKKAAHGVVAKVLSRF